MENLKKKGLKMEIKSEKMNKKCGNININIKNK